MPLPKTYGEPGCSLARSLEIVGERWTLLIVRDVFYGVRRFGDFVDHLGIPRSVLAARLDDLVEHGILVKTANVGRGYDEYELTDKGGQLWPAIHSLIAWGDEHYAPGGAPRLFEHAEDGGRVGADGVCTRCGQHLDPAEMQAVPGPGLPATDEPADAATVALRGPHRLLEPVRGSA